MTNFAIYPIVPSLQKYIKLYCSMQNESYENTQAYMVAQPMSCLLFNFGTNSEVFTCRYQNSSDNQKSFEFKRNKGFLGGLHNTPIMTEFANRSKVICLVLTPLGVQLLLNDDAKHILNNGFSLEDLDLYKNFEPLMEQLANTEDLIMACQLVEKVLLDYFQGIETPFSIKDMSPITDYIWRHSGNVKVKDLEEKFRISRRWIEKQFAAQIGLSPKEYARLIRFHALLKIVSTNPTAKCLNIGDSLGYYDQSHLTRDFKEFAAQTPAEFFKETPSIFNNVFN